MRIISLSFNIAEQAALPLHMLAAIEGYPRLDEWLATTCINHLRAHADAFSFDHLGAQLEEASGETHQFYETDSLDSEMPF